jgi:predicted Zn-dependent protease
MIVHRMGKTAILLKHIVSRRHASSGIRPVRRYIVLVTFLLAFSCSAAGAEDLSKDQRQWWIDHYGLIDAKTEPLVVRAENIFSRVASAADKKSNRLPKLVVIGGTGDPYSLTLRDGSVILTLEGLKICYNNAFLETGDSRLAFLIGHELAHLAKDDFWHSTAFAAVNGSKDDAKVRRILKSQLEKSGGSLDFVKTQELQADSYGIIYMTMAGYDPKAIIGPDGTNFFQYWVSQITEKLAYSDAAHVSPEARAEFVRTELQPVIGALDHFSHGVQLYQNGNYQEAASSFRRFIEKYPGREVYNNLGLSHYQLAMKTLAECNELRPYFALPMVLDPETTAQKLRETLAGERTAYLQNESYQNNRSLPMVLDPETTAQKLRETLASERAACFQNESYQTNLQEAIRSFEEAEKKDTAYLPARINLSTALIMSRDYAKAISVADETLKVNPASPEALNNKTVAENLFGKKNNAENLNALAAGDAPHSDRSVGAEAVPSQNGPTGNPGVIGAGLTIDPYNFSFGPSIAWWPAEYFGFQASYGQGTFTTYTIHGLVRYGQIAGMTPYAGIGFLNVEREANLLGVTTRFSGHSGEIVAGVMLPLSNRLSLLTAVTANNIKLEKTVYPNGQAVHLTMDYSPVSISVTLVY